MTGHEHESASSSHDSHSTRIIASTCSDEGQDPLPSWRFAEASVTGASHARASVPCQDASNCEIVATRFGQVFIGVVSDGAGSAAQGAIGAHYICQELVTIIRHHLITLEDPESAEWLKNSIARARAGLLSEAERLRLPARELAATLLCAVLAEQWSAFGQIGDGAIVTPELGTDMWAWLFWPQHGEYANTTSFLTDPTAMQMLQVDRLSHAQHEVAMFTDGLQLLVLNYKDQTVHSPFFERMMGPVRRSTIHGKDRVLSSGLAKYLASTIVTARADDDLTLVIASRVVDGTNVGQTR